MHSEVQTDKNYSEDDIAAMYAAGLTDRDIADITGKSLDAVEIDHADNIGSNGSDAKTLDQTASHANEQPSDGDSVVIPQNPDEQTRFDYELTYYVNNVNTQNTQVLMEYGKRDELKNVYTYGNERISAETIADTFNTATDDFETDYYLYDGRGSVANVITDVSDIVASYTYDPFGNVTSGAPAFGSFYGYNAEETNPVTGMQYLRARYYDTQDGRFGVRDKILGDIAEPLTLNRYAYVINNPLMYIDSTGEWLQALIGAAVGGVVGAVTGAANEVISAAVEKRPINFKQMGVKALTGAAGGAVSGAVFATTGSVKLAATAGGAVGGAVGGFAGTLVNGGGLKDAFVNAGKGAVTGAIGGFIGGSVGGAVGSSFGNLLGTLAGSIVGGSASRAISTLLYGGSLSAAIKAAVDPRQIVIDGLTGAVGYAAYQKIGVPLKTYLDAKTTQIKAQVQKFNCGDAEKIGKQGVVEEQSQKSVTLQESKSSSSNQKAEILRNNAERGASYEKSSFAEYSNQHSHSETQITVVTDDGIRTRLDAIGLNETTGTIEISEFKSSATAPLTKNQANAFPQIEQSGATVVGKGKGIFTGGTKIPPTNVEIVRPSNK